MKKKLAQQKKKPSIETSRKKSLKKNGRIEIARGVFAKTEQITFGELLKRKEKAEKRRQEESKWNIPPPSQETITKLFNCVSSNEYYSELSEVIRSWFNEHPEIAFEMFSKFFNMDKNHKKEWKKSLESMARPIKKRGLAIPYPKKYPFGIHFLTFNIISQLYGMRFEILEPVLSHISKRLSPILRKVKDKVELSDLEAEIIEDRLKVYGDVLNRVSKQTAWEMGNLERYLNKSFKNFWNKFMQAKAVERKKVEKEISLTELERVVSRRGKNRR